jgi:hypothetical protein
LTVAAQTPSLLLHTLRPAVRAAQTDAGLGRCVAMDGELVVVGAPQDSLGRQGSGVVQVFEAATGRLLHVLPNPKPSERCFFGDSVGISGSWVVVGAPFDDTGGIDLGRAYVFDLSGARPTVPVHTLNNPGTGVGHEFGESVAISGTRVVVYAPTADHATGVGSAYVYDLAQATPRVPVAILRKPTRSLPNYTPVAISGTRVVIGDPEDETGGTRNGSVHVYDLALPAPGTPVATVRPPPLPPSLEPPGFGAALAISGSLLVVGARNASDGPAFRWGIVYVFDLSSAFFSIPVATLANPDPEWGRRFGGSVAIDGWRVVVGTWGDRGAVGRAYAYDLEGPKGIEPVAMVPNPDPYDLDYFGGAVAVSGNRLVVAASGDDNSGRDAGNAYVYDFGPTISTVPKAMIQAAGTAAGSSYGAAVALTGSVLAVGAPDESLGLRPRVGRVYLHHLAGATPTLPARVLSPPDEALAADMRFGTALAAAGGRLAVSAPAAGSVYLYAAESGVLEAALIAQGAASGSFGAALAVSGARVVVGDPLAAVDGVAAGTVSVFDVAAAPVGPAAYTMANPSPSVDDLFGAAVAIDGSRVVVGAPGDDTRAPDAGRIYVYDLAADDPGLPVLILDHPTPEASDRFGDSVAVTGTLVVVGAPMDDHAGMADAGSVFVFDLAGPSPGTLVGTLTKPLPKADDQFGSTLAASGALVVVGCPLDDPAALNAGSGFVFRLGGSNQDQPEARLAPATLATEDRWGTAVAIDGARAALGSPFDDTAVAQTGSVLVFASPDADADGLVDSWEVLHFGRVDGQGADDDFDGDGLTELMEQAFALNPKAPDSRWLPPVIEEDGYLSVTIPKQPGISYRVESAGSLVPGRSDSFSPDTVVVTLDSATTLKARDSVRIGSEPARFLRVRVTAAP